MRKLLILLLFPFIILAQEVTLIGDVDCSGDVNSEDASLILQFVTSIITELPCEENMTGLTPEQLQEIINMMNEQLSISYNGGGGGNYPVMISAASPEVMSWGDALIYCADLEENDYSDWFLPNLDQLTYAVSGGCELPDERLIDAYLWTATKSHYGSSTIVVLSEEGDFGLNNTPGSSQNNCRCVRLGESETNDGSNNSSSTGTSTNGIPEQAVSMIGPMYRYDECNEDCFSNSLFMHPFENYQEANTLEHRLYFADAIKFCGQLEYGGHSDWFLPNIKQLTDYIAEGNSVSLPNIIDCDNEVCTWEFWTISGTSNSAGITYTMVQETDEDNNLSNAQHYLVGFGEGWSYNGYKKCFCVR